MRFLICCCGKKDMNRWLLDKFTNILFMCLSADPIKLSARYV